jgi:Tfp pilus assembly protein PilN
MKSINFISPVPPKKQKALLVWFYGSIFTFLALITVVMYHHLRKRELHQHISNQLTELKERTVQLQALKTKNEQLIQEKKLLQTRLQQVQKIRHKSNNAFHMVTSLSLLIPQAVCLTELTGAPGKTIVLKGVAKSAKAATEFFNKLLVSCPFIADLKLITIMPYTDAKQGPLCTFSFEGTWQKELALFSMESISVPIASEQHVSLGTINAPH